MKYLIIILVMGLIVFSAFAEEIKEVDFVRDGENFYRIETIKEIIVKIDTISYRINNDTGKKIDNKCYQEAIQNSGEEFVVYDSLKLTKLFPPRVEKSKFLVWLEDQELNVNLEQSKRFSWECVVFYIYSLLAGPLLVLIHYSYKKEKKRKRYLVAIFSFLTSALALVLALVLASAFASAFALVLALASAFALVLALASAFALVLALASAFVLVLALVSALVLALASASALVFNNEHLLLVIIVIYILSTIITYLIMKPKFKRLLALKKAKEE